MKLLILGPTGPTGLQIVNQALEQNHEVTAFARTPSKLAIEHKNLRVVKGDIRDRNALISAVHGQDAVMSTLGVGKKLKANDLITTAVSNIIPVMEAEKVKRLIFLSAFGIGKTFKQANLLQKFFFRTFLTSIYGDKNEADKIIHQSPLDWTLVCPVVLTNAPFIGNYEVGEKMEMKGMPTIPRADVAHFMLTQLASKTFLKKTVILKS